MNNLISIIKKNILAATLLFFILILGYLVVENKDTLFKVKTLKEEDKQTATVADKYNLPVRINSPNVGGVFIHYFFTGKLKELQKIEEGTKIILENADVNLPVLIVTNRTRVSRIAFPYESNSTPISINTLKPGQTIDISAEFDIRAGTWSVLDVFFSTDRN